MTFRFGARALVACVAAILAALAAPASAQEGRPGIGPNEGWPLGKPLALPAGLEIAGPILGAREFINDDGDLVAECPDGSRFPEPKRDVQVCIPLCNYATSANGTMFPPGLIIVSSGHTFQNGLVVDRTLVTVPPKNCTDSMGYTNTDSEEDERIRRAPAGAKWVPVAAYCLNSDKVPSEGEAEYAMGPITSDAQLLKLLPLIQNRKVTTKDDMDEIKQVIWDVSDRNRPPRPSRLERIKAIPPLN
jgi:hypothetical protein